MTNYLHYLAFITLLNIIPHLNAYPIWDEQKQSLKDSTYTVNYDHNSDRELLKFLLHTDKKTQNFYHMLQNFSKNMDEGWLQIVQQIQTLTANIDIKNAQELLQQKFYLPNSIKEIVPINLTTNDITFTSALLIYLAGFSEKVNVNDSNFYQEFDNYVNSCIDNSYF